LLTDKKGCGMKKKADVSVIMGSDSDLATMTNACETLKNLGLSFEVRILSAHRSCEDTIRYAKGAGKRGIKVIIAGAGGAAHLAGVIAANTDLPVVGVPMKSPSLGGMDSLLSMAQMPGGVPVATMAIGDAGARNAAVMAAEILALGDKKVAVKLTAFRRSLRDGVRQKDRRVRSTF